MVGARHDQQVGKHSGGDGASVLLHLRLLRVGELWDDGGDLRCRTALACRDQDQQLHDMVIDVLGAALDDVDVLVSNRDADLHRRLTVGKLLQRSRRRFDAQVLANEVAELGMRVTNENLTLSHTGWLGGWLDAWMAG